MLYPYRYAAQFERYIGQFMRVFSAFQTQDGVERDGVFRTKRVPVVYGNMSRVVATVLQQRNKLASNRLPMMAVNLQGVQKMEEEARNQHHHETIQKPGTDDTVSRIFGPAFNLSMEVSVYASSTAELFSIVEQILLIFNPRITIQTDTNVLNSDYITEISLESMTNEIQYPMGPQEQVVMFTLNFMMPVRLRYPAKEDLDAIIKKIRLEIYEMSQGDPEDSPSELVIIDEDGARKENETGTWLTATGSWNDKGTWEDSSEWNDGV